MFFFFFSSRRRHTRCSRDWSSDVCSSDLFGSDTETTPPAHAKAVFTPNGQSIGYVGRAGSLVIYPGYTNDLTRPFSPKLVRLAMNTIPGKDRTDDATPLFDVNGGYVGYLAGPVF